MSRRLVGLAGKKQCGKDTVAGYLVREHGFEQDSFAEPIRKFVADLCSYTRQELEAKKEEVHPVYGQTPRMMMQTLGTEWGRNTIKDSIWLAGLLLRLAASGADSIVISDLRFDNEAEAIREAGGVIIHLARGVRGVVDSHASESGVTVAENDYYIPNKGTIADLDAEICELILHLEFMGWCDEHI